MIKFRKARSPRETLNALDEYLANAGDEPVKWLAREVQSWGEFSYAELEAAISDGRLNELINWQERYAKVVNEHFRPMWLAAIAAAAHKESKGRITISDSDISVRDWLMNHGGKLITQLSEESRKAIMTIILDAQQTHNFDAKAIAREIRPLIGLTTRQVEANAKYRQKIFDQYIKNGASVKVASQRAESAALKYASKQHRYRAETIVNTELAFAYNQGAHIGVMSAINAGLMGHCAMIWTTAGTNRVCPRCLALKGTVVGHTNESGVTLPPIHPRCRCTIEYRELTAAQGNANVTPRGLAAGNVDVSATEGSPPKLIGQLKKLTPEAIQKTLEHYEAQIVTAPVEHAIIITAAGEIYHCNGDVHGIPKKYFYSLGEKLKSSTVTHNHPPAAGENDHTFSDDDKRLFLEFCLTRLHGIEENFIYEINRNPKDNELYGHDLLEIYSMGFDFKDNHAGVMLWALTNELGYWRRPR